jgi:exosome complex component RRP4
MSNETKRQIVIPGEVIAKGEDFLPGEWTEKTDEGIIALKFGLAEEINKLVKVIPLAGVYVPRRGNVVIGQVEMITPNGWVIKVSPADNGFLPLSEVQGYINKNDLEDVMNIGDMAVAKIFSIGRRGIDLSIRSRGLGKINEGIITEINPNKVPRVIGKEGSMINLIKDKTGCNITVGQNGIIWIRGEKIEDELLAKRAIEFVSDKSFLSGLTEETEKWFEKNGGKK